MALFGRTVLSMMDDALYVYKASSKVEFVRMIDWETEGFSELLQGVLDHECGGAPVLIFNDMVEQYYRKERVYTAGVGTLDKKSMVDRKLGMVFPSYSVRTSIALKEKVQREGGKAASDVYLFAAIAGSSKLNSVIDGVRFSSAAPLGLGLLPLESVSMVEALVKKLGTKGQAKAKDESTKWNLVIGQHRNGFLRQIVVRNGDIALTRMTQVLDSEGSEDIGGWADDVSKQFASTMNYLSRLGYQVDDGLNIILLAPTDRAERVRSLIEGDYSFYNFTPEQAAGLLGVKLSKDNDERYSDIVNVGWGGKSFSPSVPLPLDALKEVTQARLGTLAASVAFGALLFFSIYQLATSSLAMFGSEQEVGQKRSELTVLEQRYQGKVDEMAELGVDLPLLQVSTYLQGRIDAQGQDPLDMVKAVAAVLHSDKVTYLNKFDFRVEKDLLRIEDEEKASPDERRARRGRRGQQEKKDAYSVTFWLEFEPKANIDLANKTLRDFRTRFKRDYPTHEVTVTKFLGDTKFVTGLLGQQGEPLKDQDMIAEIVIKGVVHD